MSIYLRNISFLLTAGVVLLLVGCSSAASSGVTDAVTISVASPTITVTPGVTAGTSQITQVVVGRSAGNVNPITLSISGAPAGLSVAIAQPTYGTYGNLSFTSALSTVPWGLSRRRNSF